MSHGVVDRRRGSGKGEELVQEDVGSEERNYRRDIGEDHSVRFEVAKRES